jgi:transcriptional regulator with XRE-family HTH domain
MNVGERIRQTREGKTWSLRQLAKLSRISPSLLSQIETGKVDPSLSTLRRIAQALDTPLFYFVLENPSNGSRLVKAPQRRTIVFPKSGLSYEILHSDSQTKMGIHIGTLGKGGFTSDEPMAHEGEECLVIIEGHMSVQLGEEKLFLEAGDSLYFDSGIPHRLVNEKDQECRFYLIITPPKF